MNAPKLQEAPKWNGPYYALQGMLDNAKEQLERTTLQQKLLELDVKNIEKLMEEADEKKI